MSGLGCIVSAYFEVMADLGNEIPGVVICCRI